MPTEGVFAIVVREGAVREGDEIKVLESQGNGQRRTVSY